MKQKTTIYTFPEAMHRKISKTINNEPWTRSELITEQPVSAVFIGWGKPLETIPAGNADWVGEGYVTLYLNNIEFRDSMNQTSEQLVKNPYPLEFTEDQLLLIFREIDGTMCIGNYIPQKELFGTYNGNDGTVAFDTEYEILLEVGSEISGSNLLYASPAWNIPDDWEFTAGDKAICRFDEFRGKWFFFAIKADESGELSECYWRFPAPLAETDSGIPYYAGFLAPPSNISESDKTLGNYIGTPQRVQYLPVLFDGELSEMYMFLTSFSDGPCFRKVLYSNTYYHIYIDETDAAYHIATCEDYGVWYTYDGANFAPTFRMLNGEGVWESTSQYMYNDGRTFTVSTTLGAISNSEMEYETPEAMGAVEKDNSLSSCSTLCGVYDGDGGKAFVGVPEFDNWIGTGENRDTLSPYKMDYRGAVFFEDWDGATHTFRKLSSSGIAGTEGDYVNGFWKLETPFSSADYDAEYTLTLEFCPNPPTDYKTLSLKGVINHWENFQYDGGRNTIYVPIGPASRYSVSADSVSNCVFEFRLPEGSTEPVQENIEFSLPALINGDVDYPFTFSGERIFIGTENTPEGWYECTSGLNEYQLPFTLKEVSNQENTLSEWTVPDKTKKIYLVELEVTS